MGKYFELIKSAYRSIRNIRNNKKGSREYYEPTLLDNYHDNLKVSATEKKLVIYRVDGGIYNPGLCDKLRGAMSMFYLCQKFGLDFRISWTYPFELKDYLKPAKYDWSIDIDKLNFNINGAIPIVIDYGKGLFNQAMVDTIIFKNRIVKTSYNEYHVYSNAIVGEKCFKHIFNTLFKVTPTLESVLKPHEEALGNKYISISTRFMELLGDFKDQEGVSVPLPETDQIKLMNKCYTKICEIIESLPEDYMVFVASDSGKFLNKVSINKRIYTVPGQIIHLRYQGSSEAYMKTFIDLLLLSNAKKQILLKTGKMYNSGFPRFASWIGTNNFHLIEF